MTNPLNHFSDVGKRVLAAKIKVMFFDSKNTAKMPNAKKNVENHSFYLEGIMSVTRDQSRLHCTMQYHAIPNRELTGHLLCIRFLTLRLVSTREFILVGVQ